MSTRLPLRRIAHCRAGDKGSDSILTLIPYDPEDYEVVLRMLVPEAIAASFGVSADKVSLRGVAGLASIVVHVRDCLAGGVTSSLRVDPHGKNLAFRLLDLEVDWPAGLTRAALSHEIASYEGR